MYGLKVSKPGVDVLLAGDQDLAYNSKYSNLKIHSVIEKTLVVSGNLIPATTTIANPLSYQPVFFPFVESTSVSAGKWRPAISNGTPEWPVDLDMVYVGATYRPGSNDFSLAITKMGSGTRTYTFRIVIFVDKLSGASADVDPLSRTSFRVSKEGLSAQANKPTDKSIDADFPSLSEAFHGNFDFPTGAIDYQQEEFTHGLGYVPIFMGWVAGSDNAEWYQMPYAGNLGGSVARHEIWADNNKIYFQGFNTHQKFIIFDQLLK